MGLFDLLSRWPVLRQLKEGDLKGLGQTSMTERSRTLEPRTVQADKVVKENYLIKKLYTALGIVQVENQARI